VVHYYRLKVFENRVIRKVDKEEEVTGQRTLATRSVLVAKYSTDQMCCGARDTDGRDEKCIEGFGDSVQKRNDLVDTGFD